MTTTFCARLLELEGNPNADNLYDLNGEIACAESQLSESEAEANGQRAHYGDAWAGADEQFRAAREEIAALYREARFCRDALGLA